MGELAGLGLWQWLLAVGTSIADLKVMTDTLFLWTKCGDGQNFSFTRESALGLTGWTLSFNLSHLKSLGLRQPLDVGAGQCTLSEREMRDQLTISFKHPELFQAQLVTSFIKVIKVIKVNENIAMRRLLVCFRKKHNNPQ